MLLFAWDANKATKNLKTHGVSFDEASTAFSEHLSLTIYDPLHSDEEDRFVLIGSSYKHRLLVVVHTDRGKKIRCEKNKKKRKRKERKKNNIRGRCHRRFCISKRSRNRNTQLPQADVY